MMRTKSIVDIVLSMIVAWLSLSIASANGDLRQPVMSLDSEHGVAIRIVQELDAIRELAREGTLYQESESDLVYIDFMDLDAAFEIIQNGLIGAIKRKASSVSQKGGR